jgi:hypothetical protein
VAVVAKYRRIAPDGREVVVERHDNGFWFVHVPDDPPERHSAAGGEMFDGTMIASALGYHIAREYPEWVDEWADEITAARG